MTVLWLANWRSDGPPSSDGAVLPTYIGLFAQRGRRDLGQRKQVVELYDEIRPSLYRYLSSLGFKPSLADDIIQETFLRLFDHIVEGKAIDNPRAWTFRVAHNFAFNLR